MNIFSNKNQTKRPDAGLDRKYLMLGFRIMGEFGATIAIPIVLLSWLGQKLDLAYGTGHRLLFAGFVLSFIISASTIYRRAKDYGREYEEMEKNNRLPKS